MKTIAIVTFGISAFASVALAADKKPLTAAEMKVLVGNGLSIDISDLKGGKEYTGHIDIKPDGTQSGTVTIVGKPPIALSGTWKLKGAKFCRVLLPIEKKEVCETWLRSGDKEVIVKSGGKEKGINKWM